MGPAQAAANAAAKASAAGDSAKEVTAKAKAAAKDAATKAQASAQDAAGTAQETAGKAQEKSEGMWQKVRCDAMLHASALGGTRLAPLTLTFNWTSASGMSACSCTGPPD